MKSSLLPLKELPTGLQEIYKPPAQLHIAGILSEGFHVAIVGMRKNTPYGERVVKEIVPRLVDAGIITVSGLAYGIDTLVHRYTLDAGGKTIAVLGSGLAKIYPQANQVLAQNIITTGGALISEYEPDEGPLKHHFPERNRIVVGLAQAVIVIEAAEKSGSLITAELALQEGRDVWAVPGRIFDESSKGTNQLLDRGAIPLLHADQFLGYYGLDATFTTAKRARLSKEAQMVLDCLTTEDGISVDKLLQTSRLDVNVLTSLLTELELIGAINNQQGNIYLL